VAVPIPDIPFDPGSGEAPGGLTWERVDLSRAVATNRLEGLMRWAGGFAMLELRPGGPHGAAVVATWTSPDGRAWARRRLPEPIRPASFTSFHALGDGLALTTIDARPSITFGTKWISVLLSDDGRRWRRGAGIELGVPAGYPNGWVLDFPAIVAAGDRLIAISRLGPNRCCGSAPSATRWASIAGGVALAAGEGAGRLVAWESVRGGPWEPAPIRVTGTRSTVVAIESLGRKGDLLTGVVLDVDYRAVFSRDGVRWWAGAAFPPGYEWGGAQEVAGDGGWTMLLGEHDPEPRFPVGYGNRLAAWLIGPGGRPQLVLDRQPVVPSGWAAEGDTLVILGRSWLGEDDGDWSWLLVSHDRGRTWDQSLAWSGALGAVFTDLVLDDGTLVMRRVDDSSPGIWIAPMPDAG